MSTPVLCAVRGAVESEVVRAVDATTELEVARRCADVAELLAACAAGHGLVAVVSAGLPGVDLETVRHLQSSGVWVLALTDDRAGWSSDRVARLGVDAVLDADAAGREVVPAILRLHARGQAPGARARPAPTPAPATVAAREPGAVVAVWGPTGAPGRTTLALTLAGELALLAAEGALLVDADTYGGTVAPALGLLDEAPGIAAACRAAVAGRLDELSLAGLTPRVEPGLRVLTGISRAERWPEVSSAGLEVLWVAARRLVPWTVVDCGFSIEQDELLSYDTRAPQRNGATLSALAEADHVVVVGSSDAIGLPRLVRAVAEVRDLLPGLEPIVVANRVRSSAAGPRAAASVREALGRWADVPDPLVIPEDRPACDAALLGARMLRESAPASPVRTAVRSLAGALLARTAAGAAH
ncbi:CpaE family protein [Actinotalea sp.]|uniref:AAA family ATPase n=1 Tax=Actinotalea sp. TaxID=1872145 RepID=UPI00356704C9